MSFLSPLWLWLLLPWVAVTFWLLWGRRRRTAVPFLSLWLGDVESPRAKRALALPPLPLLAAIIATLLAVLAAARPALPDSRLGPLVTIIVDRGITMSPAGRLEEVTERANRELRALGARPVDLLAVPGGDVQRTDPLDWIKLTRNGLGTVIDTHDALARAIRDTLARNDSPLIVLTDQPVPGHPRIIRIAPTRAPENVALTHLAVREAPTTQAMVTVRNESDHSRAELLVESGGRTARQALTLPPRGGERHWFVDLPAVGTVVSAQIDVQDDFGVDNRRWLVKERTWPRVEIHSDVPPEVRRVVDAYQRARPPGEGSEVVVVARDLRAGERGVALDAANDVIATTRPGLVVRDHHVTANVAWSELLVAPLRGRSAAESADSTPWTSLVSVNNIPLLAVRSTALPQARTTLHSGHFAATPDFVILWTNLLDWLGGGNQAWTSHDTGSLGDEWHTVAPTQRGQPGLYQRSDGARRAVHLAPVHFDHAFGSDNRAIERHAGRAQDPGGKAELLPLLALAALAALLIGALTWPKTLIHPQLIWRRA